ncbi:putative integral membrane protein [Anaerosolibacter carboniphilus]|uniref:Putative integral membrane protein n=1 Tax=Anaerosolibacter carboniphilus TaxID=1417629 RepID=A0A841KYP7_9FIRM|nr:putative integral membrane protein [Anaerosolibacter carboniphilus]
MFIVGLLLLMVGACLVYGTASITRFIPVRGKNQALQIKMIGLTCAVIGVIIIFKSEIPRYLEWIRIL